MVKRFFNWKACIQWLGPWLDSFDASVEVLLSHRCLIYLNLLLLQFDVDFFEVWKVAGQQIIAWIVVQVAHCLVEAEHRRTQSWEMPGIVSCYFDRAWLRYWGVFLSIWLLELWRCNKIIKVSRGRGEVCHFDRILPPVGANPHLALSSRRTPANAWRILMST